MRRSSIHGGIAGDHPLYREGPVVFAAGLFLDAAGIAGTVDESPAPRLYLDGGSGLRTGIADARMGVLRIDLARDCRSMGSSRSPPGSTYGWPLFGEGYALGR